MACVSSRHKCGRKEGKEGVTGWHKKEKRRRETASGDKRIGKVCNCEERNTKHCGWDSAWSLVPVKLHVNQQPFPLSDVGIVVIGSGALTLTERSFCSRACCAFTFDRA